MKRYLSGFDGLVPADSSSGGGCSLSGAVIPAVSWRTGVCPHTSTTSIEGCKVHIPSTQVTSGTIPLRRRTGKGSIRVHKLLNLQWRLQLPRQSRLVDIPLLSASGWLSTVIVVCHNVNKS